MATTLFKLVMSATTQTVTTPTITNYFNIQTAQFTGTTLTINAADFQLDDGTAATTITTVTTNDGYYLLYINGQLQQASTYAVTSASVVITFSSSVTIPANAPITLVVASITSTSTTTVAG